MLTIHLPTGAGFQPSTVCINLITVLIIGMEIVIPIVMDMFIDIINDYCNK